MNGQLRQIDPNSLQSLSGKLGLIGRLIQKGLGTRIYYVQHRRLRHSLGPGRGRTTGLLGELSNSVGQFLQLAWRRHADRVALMTYSEFGRRVKENGSRGTDHGAGSCMFVAGHKVVGGLVGKHPSLSDLTDGDIKYHTDFRRVYATLLDDWLGVPSKGVLDDTFEKMAFIDMKKKSGGSSRRARRPKALHDEG